MKPAICFPARPYISPICAAALSMVMCSGFMMQLAWKSYLAQQVFPISAAGLFAGLSLSACLGLYIVRLRTAFCASAYPYLVWIGIGLCIASLSCALWMYRQTSALHWLDSTTHKSYQLETKGDPQIHEYGATQTATLIDSSGFSIGTVHLKTPQALEAGVCMQTSVVPQRFDDSPWSQNRFMQGEFAEVSLRVVPSQELTLKQDALTNFRQVILRMLQADKGEAEALLAGVICGRTTELHGTDVKQCFSDCGLSHLIAISGGHLIVCISLVEHLLLCLHIPLRPRLTMLIGFMSIYVVFSGMAPSAIRALLMMSSSMVVRSYGRRPHQISGLAFAVMVLLAIQPGLVFDLGFQLSALSVLGLSIFGPYLRHHLKQLHMSTGLTEALSATLIAMLMTAPLTIPLSNSFSIIAPLANVVVGPLITLVLTIGFIAAPLAYAIPFVLTPVLYLARTAIFFAQLLASFPFAQMNATLEWWGVALWYCAIGMTYVLWDALRLRHIVVLVSLSACLGVSFCIYWRYLAPPMVGILQIGQGDSILIRDHDQAILVDAGVDDKAAQALARQHVTHLDAVVITHWDKDHWGGLPKILQTVSVDMLYVARGATAHTPLPIRWAWRHHIAELIRGDKLSIGSFKAEVIWPISKTDGEENASSVCMVVSYTHEKNRLRVLLTGDTELEQELKYAQSVGDIDVLKIGHHGSKVSTSKELLDILTPELAVASAGKHNRYGHPSQKCQNACREARVLFMCTKDVGDVQLYPSPSGVVVQTQFE
ncbi:DNA internalization-related competence protein ComEC/Rec2 [Collinsella sp. zg1085]|uniref:DNA internalization-related competence protein ComEC/Rec2 n=1 Tax=Collinsella sp. zg1085 TaxID=2844380 RepID=UPI001C0B8D6A|nr:DNA internalization-related competence protein ComEC/Rec2 [Collinsella sp. zg1085]QWT16974.1 DNA internalization-related competence protein ComEC/Rec2 [Collinsella sp. zg1085]